jgi:hypothetical protein
MGRDEVVSAVVVVLLAVSCVGAADCGLINAGFEDDAQINNISVLDPTGWDANLPAGKFQGYVSSDWATGGHYSLTLYSDWFVIFVPGDMAIVSQEMMLDDVDTISFDLKLNTRGYTPWDPNICSAVVVVDHDVVWTSGFGQADIRGEYLDQTYAVDAKYRDGRPHRLGVGLQMHVAGMLFERYASSWDSLECVPLTSAAQPVPGDFNGDGFIDLSDLVLLGARWLDPVGLADPYNLSGIDDDEFGGVVNFYDFAVLGVNWRASPVEQGE